MKSRVACLLCTFRTAYDIARKSTDDERLQERIILETAEWLTNLGSARQISPAALHTQVCRIARKISGNSDPFSSLKRQSNKAAIKVLPLLERRIEAERSLKEAFQLAVKIAICGNAVDFEVENYRFSLDEFDNQILSCVEKGLAIDHTSSLMKYLEEADKVLYLLDNAGEIIFDKLLINMIRQVYECEIWAVVKGSPVINDALMEDAEEVELTSSTHVISTGNDHIGVELETASEEFLMHLKTSDMVLAKGQGCYETLTEFESKLKIPICYLLKAKCPIVAEDLGVPLNSSVVKIVNPHV